MLKRAIDRAAAPSAFEANKWLDDEKAVAVNIYLSGIGEVPERVTWTDYIVKYLADIGFEFFLCSPGPQYGRPDLLTEQQGIADAVSCAAQAKAFGFIPVFDDGNSVFSKRTTIAADIEADTSYYYPSQSLEYTLAFMRKSWELGYYPAVYGLGSFIRSCAGIDVPSRVWIAEWEQDHFADWDDVRNPYQLRYFPNGLWSKPGQRMVQGVNQKQRGIDLNLTDWTLTRPQYPTSEQPEQPDYDSYSISQALTDVRNIGYAVQSVIEKLEKLNNG